MSTPYPTRSRLSRSSMSTPNRGLGAGTFALSNSPSTPYDIYNQRNHSPHSFSSPRSSSAFLPPSTSQSTVAYRKSTVFGSPGVGRSPRFSQGVGTSTPTATPRSSNGPFNTLVSRTPKFIRRKTFKQRLLDLPSSIYDSIIFSDWLDFADPAIGYPAGLLLHALSILSLALHPEGPLHLSYRGIASSQAKANKLFSDQGAGGLAWRRRQSRDDAWRWLATMMAFSVLIAALANAYQLFTARRRYALWMKPTTEKLPSENASFVDLPHALDEETHLSISDRLLMIISHIGWTSLAAAVWILEQILHRLRQIPYLGAIIRFLFPPTLSRRQQSSPSESGPNQMHAIDMWTAPDVQLRIFCLYSPLHAIVYVYLLKSNGGLSSLLLILAMMAAFSGQVLVLVHYFTTMVKDKNLVAGEVMHEYNEKFVKPRAMPMSRDAWTMTDEAEISAAKRQSWINRRHSSDEEDESSSHRSKRATPVRKGRATTGTHRGAK